MDSMEWSDIKIFLAIARHGTLGAAARQAGVSQPTMGRRLKALEASMSASLFQRTPDGFVLTAAGEAALAHAEQMEEEALAFERDVAGESRQLEGLLRVSSSDWFGVHMLSPVLAQFMRRHPGVQVELLTDSRLLNLSRREADLVLRIHPFDEPDVLQRKLMHVPYALYGAAGGAVPQAGDGAGATLLTMDTAFRGFPDAQWLRRMLPNARIAFGSNSREAQAAMCAEGLGLAVLPVPLAARTSQLQSIDLGEPPPGRDVWLGYHRDMRQSARLRALIDHMASALG